MFFLNVAYIDMGKPGGFDFLLNAHTGSLPLDIQLAIGHEAKELRTRSQLLKKQEKHLRKMLRDNSELRNSVRALYNVPVRELPPPRLKG